MRIGVRGVIVRGGLSGRGGYDDDGDEEAQLGWTSMWTESGGERCGGGAVRLERVVIQLLANHFSAVVELDCWRHTFINIGCLEEEILL